MEVTSVAVHAFEVPVDGPDGLEQDGTLAWSSTVLVLVEASAGDVTGFGYTYGAMAVSAVDIALWDLKARLTGCPGWSHRFPHGQPRGSRG